MLYSLISEYMSKHNVASIKGYIEFIEKELNSKMTKLVIFKYIIVMIIISLTIELIYSGYNKNNDMLFMSTLLISMVMLAIVVSNINNKIHYVKVLMNLTLDMDKEIPMLNIMVLQNKDVKEKLILSFNRYLSALSTCINLTHKETFKSFEQHQIHNLI